MLRHFSFHLVATMAGDMSQKLCTRLTDLFSISATFKRYISYMCMNACRLTRFSRQLCEIVDSKTKKLGHPILNILVKKKKKDKSLSIVYGFPFVISLSCSPVLNPTILQPLKKKKNSTCNRQQHTLANNCRVTTLINGRLTSFGVHRF